MNCSARETLLPKHDQVSVNGVPIPRNVIAREVQYHPSQSPIKAWRAAAQALVVRELLLQEARRIGVSAVRLEDGNGRKETEEESLIRALIEQEVVTPQPDTETCRRYYNNNRNRFRSVDLFEAAHILIAALPSDARGYASARAVAADLIARLEEHPEEFADLARTHSACPSAAQGGSLGQVSSGQTTPEFERALKALAPGGITPVPVETRYGFHIVRLDRRIDGQELPFEAVEQRIAEYLADSVRQRATAQFIARLVSTATVTGIDLPGAGEHRVN